MSSLARCPVIHTGVVMDIIMNDEHICSITQLKAFLKGVDGAVTFSSETKGNKNKDKTYEWIGRTLGKRLVLFTDYAQIGERGSTFFPI